MRTDVALEFPTPIPETPPPTPAKVDLMRTKIDPRGMELNGKVS